MQHVSVTWDQDVVRADDVATSPHPLLAESGPYCVLAARLDSTADLWCDLELLSIGAADRGPLRDAILADPGTLRAARAHAGARGKQVVIMLGSMGAPTLGHATPTLRRDVAVCLSRANKVLWPAADDQVLSSDLIVVNEGDFGPLHWRARVRAAA